MSRIRIALAQFDFPVGDVAGNSRRVVELAERARDELGARIVLFPELCLSGYLAEDLFLRPAFVEACRRELEALAESVDRIFFFEGAVMDGVPVFNLVRETMPAIAINGFRGVINSTCNFILTELERGKEFDVALAEINVQKDIAQANSHIVADAGEAWIVIEYAGGVGEMNPRGLASAALAGVAPPRLGTVDTVRDRSSTHAFVFVLVDERGVPRRAQVTLWGLPRRAAPP